MLTGRIICQFMPYITLAVFVLGVVYRIGRWHRAGVSRIPLFPAPSSKAGKWVRIAGEILTFNNLKATDQALWMGTTLFHGALILVLLGHARVVADFSLLREAEHSDWAGAFLGLALLLAGIFLLVRRVSLNRVRTVSSFEDYASIVLILAVVISGDLMRFSSQFDLAQSRDLFSALLLFREPAIPSVPFFTLHFFLSQVLIMYIPFSKFLHIPGVFYSKSILYQQ